MKYQEIYDRLCEDAKNRETIEGYTEKHHIVPRSLGGGDGKENIVTLTYKEHKLAHHLLTKIYPHSAALATCYRMMSGNIDDAGRKAIQCYMKEYNPSYRGVWNKGKNIRLRKTDISDSEKKATSERMKRNNPNADGALRRKVTRVESIDGKVRYIFNSLKEAEEKMRKITNQVINHGTLNIKMKKGQPYRGYLWIFE